MGCSGCSTTTGGMLTRFGAHCAAMGLTGSVIRAGWVVADETGFLRKGTKSAGVQRQYSSTDRPRGTGACSGAARNVRRTSPNTRSVGMNPRMRESVLADGCADFVSVGRALYADPHWGLKAFGEVAAPIRKCIACNVCFERLTLEKDVACVHNPICFITSGPR